jgi:hypothetical protein
MARNRYNSALLKYYSEFGRARMMRAEFKKERGINEQTKIL